MTQQEEEEGDQTDRLRYCLAEMEEVEVMGPPDPVLRAVHCRAGQGRAEYKYESLSRRLLELEGSTTYS